MPEYAVLQAKTYNRAIDAEFLPNNIALHAALWSQEGWPVEWGTGSHQRVRTNAGNYAPGSKPADVRKRLTHAVTTQIQPGLARVIKARARPPNGEAAWIANGGVRGPTCSDDATDPEQR